MELPQELWTIIVGDDGLVFESLFLVNKLLHKYMNQIKNQYVFNTTTQNKNSYIPAENFKSNSILLLKYNNATYNLKYKNNNYILDMPYDKQNAKHIFDNLRFTEYQSSPYLDSLGIYICDKLTFFIRDNNVFNSYDLNNYEYEKDMHNLIKLVKDQIDVYDSSRDDEIKLALIGFGSDVVATIMFVSG